MDVLLDPTRFDNNRGRIGGGIAFGNGSLWLAGSAELLRVDPDGLRQELPSIKEHFGRFGDRLPQALKDQLDALEQRLGS